LSLINRDILSPKEKTPRTRPGGELPVQREITLSPGVTPIPGYPTQHTIARQQVTYNIPYHVIIKMIIIVTLYYNPIIHSSTNIFD